MKPLSGAPGIGCEPMPAFATSARSSPPILGKRVDRAVTRAVEHARGYVTGGTLFEEMGFFHIGPIDGHNLEHSGAGAARK